MGAAFTPGPWEAAGNIVRTARRPADMSGLLVAECSLHNERRHFDARLIAAAPELLEALQAMRDTLRRNGYATQQADAAIAKATGEQA